MNSMVQEVTESEGNTTCNISEFLSDFDLFVQEYTDFKKYVLDNINSVNEKLKCHNLNEHNDLHLLQHRYKQRTIFLNNN